MGSRTGVPFHTMYTTAEPDGPGTRGGAVKPVPKCRVDHPERAQNIPTCTLNTGAQMPMLGLGMLNMISGQSSYLSLIWALQLGYRLFDTAYIYDNEADVGAVLRKSGLPREELFVTTKLWNSDHGYREAREAFDYSLRKLGLDYIDLYLVQWPVTGKRADTWRRLEEIHAEGRAKAIGVSNYTVRHLEELLEHAEVVPAVNQVEFSPFLYQRELLEYCRERGIQLQAFCPLTRKRKLNDRRVAEIAARLEREPAQVLLRWQFQHDVAAVFKSVHQGHIRRNALAFDFELSDEDMAALDALDEGFRVCPDPTATK